MSQSWRLVAFPLILPWREEFWTLPLYFPDLKVGVIPGWPPNLPYEGLSLPPAAEATGRELRDYRPGELLQWQAFREFRASQEETADIIRELRGESPEPVPKGPDTEDPLTLAWQLEKMQADQEAGMVMVDQGQAWLTEVLHPEPWESPGGFAAVPGLKETVDPELARLRYLLWLQVMQPHLTAPWVPVLLGRTARAMFAALLEPQTWQTLPRVRLALPGCRSDAEQRTVMHQEGRPAWVAEFRERLSACLGAAGDDLNLLQRRAQELNAWLAAEVLAHLPATAWLWEMEIWAALGEKAPFGPVLCWLGAGTDILPG